MILVTGATGEYGRNAIEYLIKNGVKTSEISALVRNAEKAKDLADKGIELRVGDYMNPDSLVKAFENVDKLLFVSGSEIETREAQHQNVVEAAKNAKVGHIIYTSFIRNTPVENSAIHFLQDTHVKTENWIKESGIPYTILQNALYLDLLPMFAGEVAQNGIIVQPAKNGKSSAVLKSELAEAAANVLTTEGHLNKTYPLSNNEAIDYNQVVAKITDTIGKEVTYQSPDPEDFQVSLREAGVPAEYIGIFTAFSVAQANGELEVHDNSLEKLIGRKPTTANQYIEKVYH